ncbi:hypothetical protein D2E98_25595 [Mycobacteroides abscessus]|nr:hypothetical protein DDJ47_16320 [Mycobacteroides abscessus]RIT33783.1 hypothetical protein D2E98_25595 [Mycobacteroides abscessus]
MAWLTFGCAIVIWFISWGINNKIVKSYCKMLPKAVNSGINDAATDNEAIRSWFFHATDVASCLPSAVLTAVAYLQLEWHSPQIASTVIFLACVLFIFVMISLMYAESSAVYSGKLSQWDISIFSLLILLLNFAGLYIAIKYF